ncbi:zinc/cadmium/mercury/lead-transporting ATPase [Aliivibrio sp. S4TY2]|uniref:zinc/cadmium/mercury/lead-transporting ATPase n=1 Tax=unclassified Aliivibrio TaxID=2645654 RepID=UPI00237842FD|nr:MULTISPECIES: zinc/cadmium/mercury/lead-transporting ATPase [unclassified Aliivibrio]MDD9155525.1 zinc/cadmium/mercury/lead-transporting ATPase [Aliivibrio sp. S4TY2]MDD9160392.1 zinc/cadmium/mercury/lead-transporting ATPase [Aliivibrio sp. S4TY1]MDD9164710.1 zinc/cadmium/mercury/lead-transporting ATPase [Aliivibrio sp. S4MY2]MDD9168516.1 zinc/cadmium/mercury/lead-transporting ATPase [Aliivibrio sp. S4MY4]MDD9185044.1 zinc/cadmium/mercury/lead-transporting ATPase [Aliivibrio sp. S4MY3]
MCTAHKTTHSQDHKHNPSSSCCAAPKITSIKAESAVVDCCSSVDKATDTDSCCGSDPGESDPLVVTAKTSNNGSLSRSWLIADMDCPSCAAKLKKAILAIPEVIDAKVIFATEKLTVRTNSEAVFAQVISVAKTTGFPLSDMGSKSTSEIESQPFWKKNLLLLILVAFLVIATGINLVNKELGTIAFTVAGLFGLIPIGRKAIRLAKNGSPFSIETLMTVAAIGAVYLGETVEAAMVILLFMLGEQLEGYASAKARSGVKALMDLVPDTALRINNDGTKEEVPASELNVGDKVQVSPGDRLAADAILLSEFASFDESALTGESVPVDKKANDLLMAGSIVNDRVIEIQIISAQGENAIDRILHLIEEAESRKAPLERFLDKFSRWYTPAMMLLSLLVIIIPPLMFGQSWDTWIYRGLAMLLIACPCALVISTPAAITSGLATAAKRGALIKGGAALEELGHIQNIAFDKTGTLTQGKPVLTDIRVLVEAETEESILLQSAAVEMGSSHPLARAVVIKAQEQGLTVIEADERETVVGKGIKGTVNDQHIELYAPQQFDGEVIPEIESQISFLEQQGKTVVLVLINKQISGLLAWRDELRPDAKIAVEKLVKLGIKPIMLTGDNERAAKAIAEELNIDYKAGLLPSDKVKYIELLTARAKTAMVGDGINDAPAMKTASIGIAMGGGTDVALETADAALTHNRLEELAPMVALSKATLSNIRQNITLALGLKAVFLVTSLLGITGLWVAVLADSGATALVTLNALRLLRFKEK